MNHNLNAKAGLAMSNASYSYSGEVFLLEYYNLISVHTILQIAL